MVMYQKNRFFFYFFLKNKKRFLPMIFTFFPWQIPHLGQEEFVFHRLILFYSQAMLPSFEIGYWKKSFSKQKKRSRIFFKKMSRGGDIHLLWQIKMMHEGGISPPYSHKGGGYHPRGGFPPPISNPFDIFHDQSYCYHNHNYYKY